MAKRAKKRRAAETIQFTANLGADGLMTERRFASLLIVQGADIDLGKHVVCDRPITMGRDTDVEFSVSDGSISREHCRVERDDQGRYVLSDLDSRNGTRLNARDVVVRTPLAEGDKIFLGGTVVRFSYADGLDMAYHAKLQELVRTDALTGLLSKREFDGAFAHAVDRAQRVGLPLAVLVMDMDGLKRINDTHGHDMGGFAITEVAQLIRSSLGDAGKTCRFGGDEFAAYLPDLGKPDAIALAQNIVAAVAGNKFEKDGVTVGPTISIGVSAQPQDGETPEALFRSADQALYRAKGAGKNQVAS